LAAMLGTTHVTIRSDLAALARAGYLERVQGGAYLSMNNYYHGEFHRRKQVNNEAKKHIGSLTAQMIRDGNTIFLNSGTTTYYVALALKRHKNLQIVTNSLSIALELGEVPTFRVILLGGLLNAQYAFVHGPSAQEQLETYRADYAILSMDGVCPEKGLSTYHGEEAVLDRIMMERAGKTIIATHSSKIGVEGFSYVSDLSSVSCLVTDEGADPQTVQYLRNSGIRVLYKAYR